MEKVNGKIPPKLFIKGELTEISEIYGDSFEELWNSLTPELKETDIKFGKIIVFGTIDNDINKLNGYE